MATYTLPTFANHLGTFTVVVESSVTGLSTPTENMVVDVPGGRESLEIFPGSLNRSVATIVVNETSDLFWGQVCAGTTMIRVFLNEGSGDTFAFGGDVYKRQFKATETANDGTTKRRQIVIALKSPLERLKDVDISAIETALDGGFAAAAQVEAASDNDWFCPVQAIFAIAIEHAFSQSYDLTDAYWQGGSGKIDLIFNNSLADITFDEVYFQTQEEDAYIGYLDTTDPDYWPSNYGTVWDLVQALALNFGLFLRYDYNPSTSRHRIQLLQRGRALDAAVNLGSPKKSSFGLEPYMRVKYAKATILDVSDVEMGEWYALGSYSAAPAPDYFDYDISIPLIFVCGYDAGTYPTLAWQRLYDMSSGDPSQIDVVKVWNYATAAQETFNTGIAKLERALLKYLVNRYRGTSQVAYERYYLSLKAEGGSHTGLQVMSEVVVDGVNHTATEVDKDFSTGDAHLTLVKL